MPPTKTASQRGRASRRKGAAGELELAAWLTEHGHPARRTAQRTGKLGDADIECESLDHLHIESKRTERLNLTDALAQAVEDAADGRTPVVMWRRNRGEWIAVIRAADLLRVLQAERDGRVKWYRVRRGRAPEPLD